MDIAGAVLDRLRQQAVYELDYRGGIIRFEQIARFGGQFTGNQIEPLFLQVDHDVMR
jgi:hypothetical protein